MVDVTVSWEKALKWREQLREQGKTVVFTNGCFDILHAGHVTLLERARGLGDVLILGLNSDASVKRLKGNDRPINNEKDRAHVMAALRSVDRVVVFDEDTPFELISTLKPDVLVKGGDWKPEDVVGKGVVEADGGRVEIIPFVGGHSTTNVIDEVVKRYGKS
ncbi:bifunctional protein HldE [bacterium BMS3Bbin04]|nr:bifunctional protein HldE [bacterium BMS3Bbin04]